MAALRCLGWKIALRRQLASTPRRLASTTSQSSSASHQGGQNNGGARVAAEAWDWKPLVPLIDDVEMARRHAEFAAEIEAIRKAIKQDRRNKRFVIGDVCTGAGMVLLSMWYAVYTEMQRSKYWRSKLLES